jgi:hypothetical protein
VVILYIRWSTLSSASALSTQRMYCVSVIEIVSSVTYLAETHGNWGVTHSLTQGYCMQGDNVKICQGMY